MANRSINTAILLGHLGRDAEAYFTPSGSSATKFAVATTRSWKDQATNEWKEETQWTNVVVWRQEKLANQLLKGKQVYIEGRLQTRDYEKDGRKVYVTEVIADQVILLGERISNGQATPKRTSAADKPASAKTSSSDEAFDRLGITDDDVPF